MKVRLKMAAVAERVPQVEQQQLLQPPGKAKSGIEMAQLTRIQQLISFDKDNTT